MKVRVYDDDIGEYKEVLDVENLIIETDAGTFHLICNYNWLKVIPKEGYGRMIIAPSNEIQARIVSRDTYAKIINDSGGQQ